MSGTKLFEPSPNNLSFGNIARLLKCSKVLTTVQSIPDAVITQQATTVLFGTQNYQAGFLDQIGSFAALYDSYRIIKVEVTFMPMYTCTSLANGIGTTLLIPLIYTVIDYDDATNLSSIAAAREYDTVQIHDDKKLFTRTFQPKVAKAVYTGSFTGFSQGKLTDWMDMASTNIQYYGLKYAVSAQSTGSTNLQQWNLSTRMTVQFTSLR